MLGREGGWEGEISSVQHRYPLYLNRRSQGNQCVDILYNRFIYIEYVYLKPSAAWGCVLLTLCSPRYPSWTEAWVSAPSPWGLQTEPLRGEEPRLSVSLQCLYLWSQESQKLQAFGNLQGHILRTKIKVVHEQNRSVAWFFFGIRLMRAALKPHCNPGSDLLTSYVVFSFSTT